MAIINKTVNQTKVNTVIHGAVVSAKSKNGSIVIGLHDKQNNTTSWVKVKEKPEDKRLQFLSEGKTIACQVFCKTDIIDAEKHSVVYSANRIIF